MDLVLLVQTTISSLLSRCTAACGRTLVASRPGAAARARVIGTARASLAVLLLLQLAACTAPPAPPVAVAADGPPIVPTPTGVPTLVPTPTVPTVVPTPTGVPTAVPTPTAVPAPRYDLVLVGGTLIDATGAPPLEKAAIAIQGRRIVQIGTPEELVTRPATGYVREFTRDVQRAKVISARALMEPAPPHGEYAGRVSASARIAAFAAQIVADERPFAVVDGEDSVIGQIHRDSVIGLLAGREAAS